MAFARTVGKTRHIFKDLRNLLAKATPWRSGDMLARMAGSSAGERVGAQFALAAG